MPRLRVRVRVVSAESAEALQSALDQALIEEQVDRSWHVSEVTLAAVTSDVGHAADVAPEGFMALICLRKQEWFFVDLLKGLVGVVRKKLSSPRDAVGS